MTIIVNASNLYVGGGVQVALSFINEIKKDMDNKYIILVSPVIEGQLEKEFVNKNIKIYTIQKTPASLKSRKIIIKKLDSIVSSINPDLVFTIFGPSYWKPQALHLTGFADGWVYNQNSVAYKRLSKIQYLKRKLYNKYKILHLKKESEYFILETKDAKKKFIETMRISSDKVFVVGNTYSSVFYEKNLIDVNNENYIRLPRRKDDEFRFVYIAHNHPNKNLELIKKVLPLLDGLNVKFILTIDNKSYKKMFGYNDKIINLGPISQNSCPSVYSQSDALFIPTLLETFSASYPEGMIMKKPILTSYYSFAKDICRDAGIYFDPLNPEDVVEKIKEIVHNKELREEKIKIGLQIVKTFETASSRAEKYIKICEDINKKEDKIQSFY